MVNISVIKNDNYFVFKISIEYIQASFMQINKLIKRLIITIYNNPDKTLRQNYLNYKNGNKMKVLLIKLVYGKII